MLVRVGWDGVLGWGERIEEVGDKAISAFDKA